MKKTSQLLGATMLALLGVAGSAHAEVYEGVLSIDSVRSRAEVAAEARQAARLGDQFGEAAFAGVTTLPSNSAVSRAAVREGAIQAARAGDLYGEAASQQPVFAGQLDRATVRAEAREAAHSAPTL